MLNPARSFFNMPRRERLGFAALIILCIAMMGVYIAMPAFVHPPARNIAEDIRLRAAWQAAKASGISGTAPLVNDAAPGGGILFAFDPNTLDSSGFLRLGLPARTVKSLLNWRRHNKHFYSAEDLKPAYNLTEEDYNRIAPYVAIAGSGRPQFERREWTSSYAPIPSEIEINSTDTTTLDRAIRGVGAATARKIIAKRNALGGFMKFEQIIDGMRLPDSTVAALREKVRINTAGVRRIKVNDATLAELSAHPYIGEKIAKGIIQLREGYGGKYTSIEQLRQAPLMTEEIYRKIAPYLVVD